MKKFFEEAILNLKYKINSVKDLCSKKIYIFKKIKWYYVQLDKEYINDYDIKSGYYQLFSLAINLIDDVMKLYDLKWLEENYGYKDLEIRLLNLKKSMEYYIKTFVIQEKEWNCEDAVENLIKTMKVENNKTVIYDSIETEYFRIKHSLEKYILCELAELSRILNI